MRGDVGTVPANPTSMGLIVFLGLGKLTSEMIIFPEGSGKQTSARVRVRVTVGLGDLEEVIG